MQEIRSSNLSVVTGICDPNKSRAQDHRSKNKLVKLSSNHFFTANNELWRKKLWLRTKTKASLKPGLKMKVVWITCDKELGGEMKFVKENYLNKSSLVNFRKSLPFREVYLKYLEKNSIAIGIVSSYIT